jgi:hypothetical protein
MGDRQPVARRLPDANVARDHRVEHELREVLADLALDIPAQPRARVVHRQQHSGDRQPRVELALHERERLQQPREPLQREVLGLHRHDHPIGRHQRADRERPERGRAVEQDELKHAPHRLQALAQALLEALDPWQLHVRARQPRARRKHLQTGDHRVHQGLRCRHIARQHLVQAGYLRARETQPDGGVRLRIDIDEQRPPPGLGDARGDIYRGRRLTNPTLLVGDRIHRAHAWEASRAGLAGVIDTPFCSGCTETSHLATP